MTELPEDRRVRSPHPIYVNPGATMKAPDRAKLVRVAQQTVQQDFTVMPATVRVKCKIILKYQ